MNTTLKKTLACAAAALLATSCGELYQVDGHARVYGSSMYAKYPADAPQPNIVYTPQPQQQTVAPVRVIHVVKVVQKKPSPQEFLKNAPKPEPEPVVEDDDLEPIPVHLLEQPAGSANVQVPAGSTSI